MKIKYLLCIISLISLQLLTLSAASANSDFYYKGSYGRGAGTVPNLDCPSDKEGVAGLCYEPCNNGTKSQGTRCEDKGKGNKKDYERFGKGTAKKQVCSGSKAMEAGLCYEECRSGYDGAGPVCWSKTPNGYVACGAGFAKNSSTCGLLITDQVLAVTLPALDAALIVASGGSAAASTAPSAGRAPRLAKALKKLDLRSAADLYGYGKQINELIPLMTSYRAVFEPVANQISKAVPSSLADVDAVLKLGETFKVIGKSLTSQQSLQLMQQNLAILSTILGVNLVPSYTGTTTDVAFQIVRDSIGAFGLIVAIYEATAGAATTPFLLGFAVDMSDVLAQYLYTTYGE